MPELTTDLGEISALTMVLRCLSLSEEDGGPVQAVGLGDGVSLACSAPPPEPEEPEEADADEREPPPSALPFAPPQPPTAAQTTPPSTAMTMTAAMSAKSRRRRYTRALVARRTRRPGGLELRLGLLIDRECSKRPGKSTAGSGG